MVLRAQVPGYVAYRAGRAEGEQVYEDFSPVPFPEATPQLSFASYHAAVDEYFSKVEVPPRKSES